MFVRQILSGKGDHIVSIDPSAEIADVASLMSRKRIGAVVVLETSGRIAGIVSERDTRGLAEHGSPSAISPSSACAPNA